MVINLPPELLRYEQFLKARTGEIVDWKKTVLTLDERIDYLNIQIAELVALQRLSIPKAALPYKPVPHYNVRYYPLDTARTDEEIRIQGDHVAAWTDGTLIGCSIKPEIETADIVYLDKFNPLSYPPGFSKFYLTTPAESGKTLYLFIGRAAGAVTYPEITTSAERETFYIIRSDKDSHFTGALGQYAKEDENLTGMITNRARINTVSIQADQQLRFKVLFWSRDSFDDTDLDSDTYLGDVDLDLAIYGCQVNGTGQWYMNVTDILLDYIDNDLTNELHVSLMNMSGTGKTAGTSGEVVVQITYSPRT